MEEYKLEDIIKSVAPVPLKKDYYPLTPGIEYGKLLYNPKSKHLVYVTRTDKDQYTVKQSWNLT